MCVRGGGRGLAEDDGRPKRACNPISMASQIPGLFPFLPTASKCPPSLPHRVLHQVLLLEAYEQLELDCAKEIDKALAKEREERGNVERKVQFLQVRMHRGTGGGRGAGQRGAQSAVPAGEGAQGNRGGRGAGQRGAQSAVPAGEEVWRNGPMGC